VDSVSRSQSQHEPAVVSIFLLGISTMVASYLKETCLAEYLAIATRMCLSQPMMATRKDVSQFLRIGFVFFSALGKHWQRSLGRRKFKLII